MLQILHKENVLAKPKQSKPRRTSKLTHEDTYACVCAPGLAGRRMCSRIPPSPPHGASLYLTYDHHNKTWKWRDLLLPLFSNPAKVMV